MAKRTGPEKRDAAARLLAEGRSTDEIGLSIGVRGSTIRGWRRNDPEFQQLLQQYLDGLYARGVLAVAERGENLTVRARRGTTAVEAVRNTMTQIGRKEARRGR